MKQKPEVRERRNQRQRDKAYYKTWRAKKRAENEAAFLARNAETMKAWRMNNTERLAAWRTKNVTFRLSGIKQQARIKGLDFHLDDEACKVMMTSPCFYCGFLSDDTVNGIDRMDNFEMYTSSNCVTCCKTCNFMKVALDANTFVERCRHISCSHGGSGEPTEQWSDMHATSLSSYKVRAKQKDLPFEISEEQYTGFLSSACYYCHRMTGANGIDRKDNTLGYTIDNCVACCSDCNYMKKNSSVECFVAHCFRIAARTHAIPTMPRCLYALASRKL
jgi:hypothetical protein